MASVNRSECLIDLMVCLMVFFSSNPIRIVYNITMLESASRMVYITYGFQVYIELPSSLIDYNVTLTVCLALFGWLRLSDFESETRRLA